MKKEKHAIVGIVMGSASDWPVMKDAQAVLKEYAVPHEVRVISAHRTPTEMLNYAKAARERGLRVLVAGAGGAAHLPGMLASATTLPVIGVPVGITALDGIDALLSIIQMPKGVPVATVAIDNAANAALLAVRVLAQSDDPAAHKLSSKLKKAQAQSAKKVRLSDRDLRKKTRR